ncbi:MAG: DUF4105 domain-containing protein, partial [Spirochaetales bacterium]|nr:DUF4105 domain-containing protein [Spirochaetales bacterium]
MTETTNPEDLEIQLVTIEPGDELYSWWGHSAIVVTDTRLGESRFYNYGLFSFEQESFFTNFAMGKLLFEVGAYPTLPALESYKRQNREIRIQTLNIPAKTKLETARFLENNILPENKQYLYDHYFENCSTRLRDILNIASGGRLKDVSTESAGYTFREITRRFSGSHFLEDTLLMFLMSGVIDEPMTEWQTMFLPVELELLLDETMVTNEEGQTVPFVNDKITWFRSEGRDSVPSRARSAVPASIGIGLGMGLLTTLAFILFRKRRTGAHVFFGAASMLAGIVIGIPGLLLCFMALFTDHNVTFWNENLFFANPLTFLALPLGIAAVSGARWGKKLLAWLWIGLTAVFLLYLILKIIPAFNQQNWNVIALLLPLYGALAYGAYTRILKAP